MFGNGRVFGSKLFNNFFVYFHSCTETRSFSKNLEEEAVNRRLVDDMCMPCSVRLIRLNRRDIFLIKEELKFAQWICSDANVSAYETAEDVAVAQILNEHNYSKK